MADPHNQSANERALELAPGADFKRKLHYVSNRVPGTPGPRGARRAQNRPGNPVPDLSCYLPSRPPLVQSPDALGGVGGAEARSMASSKL